MPVYRLEPVAGEEDHKDWRASSIPPLAVWVRADNEQQARERVQLAGLAAYRGTEGMPISVSPWVQPHLTLCELDVAHDPGDHVILRSDGKTETAHI